MPTAPKSWPLASRVTERHIAELKLAESEARFRDLADKSADVVWRFVSEPSPHFDYMSPRSRTSSATRLRIFSVDFARMLDILDDAGRSASIGPSTVRKNSGASTSTFVTPTARSSSARLRPEWYLAACRVSAATSPSCAVFTENTVALALHDPLTGLANRRLFNELFDADLARTQRSGLPLAVAFLDLDGFKNVNDTYGHDAGDIVLCETARRLMATVRGADVVARIGGDEFVIVYEPTEPKLRTPLIQRVDCALSAPDRPSLRHDSGAAQRASA